MSTGQGIAHVSAAAGGEQQVTELRRRPLREIQAAPGELLEKTKESLLPLRRRSRWTANIEFSITASPALPIETDLHGASDSAVCKPVQAQHGTDSTEMSAVADSKPDCFPEARIQCELFPEVFGCTVEEIQLADSCAAAPDLEALPPTEAAMPVKPRDSQLHGQAELSPSAARTAEDYRCTPPRTAGGEYQCDDFNLAGVSCQVGSHLAGLATVHLHATSSAATSADGSILGISFASSRVSLDDNKPSPSADVSIAHASVGDCSNLQETAPIGTSQSLSSSSCKESSQPPLPNMFERSKIWVQKREERLQRLREMHTAVAPDARTKVRSSLREPSPKSSGSAIQRDSPRSTTRGAYGSLGPPSLFARGEASREQKRVREKALREEAWRNEVSDCTFKPKSFGQSVRAVTPDRARRLFERHLSWKQRLDDDFEKQRQQKRQADEQEIKALQRSKSADAVVRRCGSHPCSFSRMTSNDIDSVFHDLYERNQKWQRARDARVEQMLEEDFSRQVQAPNPPRVVRVRSSEPTVPRIPDEPVPSTASNMTVEQHRKSMPVNVLNKQHRQQSAQAVLHESCLPPLPQPTDLLPSDSVFVPPQELCTSSTLSQSIEHAQVMDHLQALQQRLVATRSCSSGTQEEPTRHERTRSSEQALQADALPLHWSSSCTAPLQRLPTAGVRGRTRSPAVARQRLQVRSNGSPNPSYNSSTPLKKPVGPGTAMVENRRRPSHSPAPPRPRLTSVSPRSAIREHAAVAVRI